MKPQFWNFKGLLPDELGGGLCSYAAILTSHFLERMFKRGMRIGDTHLRAVIPKFWESGIFGKVCGVEIEDAYIYYRKEWNETKLRYQLVFITITPNNHFLTKNLKDAVMVTLDS